MSIKRFTYTTKDEQVVNCLLALCKWSKVPPRRVALELWTCGAKACFGGHLATWPEFNAMGVSAGSEGAPRMRSPYNQTEFFYASRTSHRLFGDDLFDAHHFQEARDLSDHALIVRRLENQIVALTS